MPDTPKKSPFAEYLGDAVYADYDGYHVVLMTGSHLDPSNTIYLDDQVFASLSKYMDRVNFKLKAGVRHNED